MIIQGSNSVSLLAGLENTGTVQEGVKVDGGDHDAFTASLLQQLSILQGNFSNNAGITGMSPTANDNNISADLNNLLAGDGLTADNLSGQNVQNFAALFGKISPTAKKVDQGINLDDTLSTLTEVLQYLQTLKNDDAGTAVNTSLNDASQSVSLLDKLINSDSKLAEGSNTGQDPAALESALSPLPQQVVADQQNQANQDSQILLQNQADQLVQQNQAVLPSQPNRDNKDKQQIQQGSDPASLAMVMSASLSQPQPLPAKNVQNDRPVNTSVSSSDVVSGLSDGQMSVMSESQGVAMDGQSSGKVSQAPALGNQQPGTEGSAAVDLMPDQGKTPATSGSETQQSSDGDANDITVSVKQMGSVDTSKNSTGMMSNLAQLNQAISAGNRVEVPAMSQHLNHPEWNQELGQKLIWMHNQNAPSAELRLNPPDLGPISIKIDVNHDQTNVSFVTQNTEVKEAIEAAIPKLREMLGGQQLNLADVNVSQQQSEQRQANGFFQAANHQNQGNNSGGNARNSQNGDNLAAIDTAEEIDSGRAVVSNGLLSVFA